MSDSKPYAFSGRFTTFRGRIVSDVRLCSPEPGNTNSIIVRALWDTGCSNTLVSKRAADFLSLPYIGSRRFVSAFGDSRSCELRQVKICIVLGASRLTLDVGVDEYPNSDPDCDVTLGIDFMSMGDMAITHDGEQLVLSFCYPPLGCPTDFTLLAPRVMNEPVAVESCVVNEKDVVENRRRGLVMLDYFEDAAKNKK